MFPILKKLKRIENHEKNNRQYLPFIDVRSIVFVVKLLARDVIARVFFTARSDVFLIEIAEKTQEDFNF